MLIGVNEFKVLGLFFRFPENKFHVREIARLAELSAPGVLKILEGLRKKNLVETRKTRVMTEVSAKRSEEFVRLKRFYNLLSLHESGFVRFLRDAYDEPEAVIVFGSFARGEDLSNSDVDVAVVTKLEKKLDLKKFESRLNRKIVVHEVILSKCRKEFLNTLCNGAVLSGYLRLFE
ncbi:MAG: nucleotidyltransferase domain-containing protein [Candidatus Micrarchaeota archaeon]